jgi:uncharacterized membrane protein YeaQ/YmgE (transglycosylase-associated protein family)
VDARHKAGHDGGEVNYRGNGMGIIAWIFIGLIAGWLATQILGGRGGLFYNLAVGLVGAIVGGFLFEKLRLEVMPDFWGNLITATIGAIVFLLIWRAIRRA